MKTARQLAEYMAKRGKSALEVAGPGTASEIRARLVRAGESPPNVESIRRYLRAAKRAGFASSVDGRTFALRGAT